MRILHAPINPAGQVGEIVKAQRKLGIKSDLLTFRTHPFGYLSTINLRLEKSNLLQRGIKRFLFFLKSLERYDVFHFHFAHTILPRQFLSFELAILKFLKKKIIFHFWGSDVRQLDIAVRKYKYHYAKEVGFDPKFEQEKRDRIKTISKYAGMLIVGDYELSEYVPGSVVIPQLFDITTIPKNITFSQDNKIIKILHAPSKQGIKGTKFIIPIIQRIKKEYRGKFGIEFILAENKSHREILDLLANVDIVIDQLLMGSYGIFSIEGMAYGKPVLCYIRKDLKKYYPGLPTINTNPGNLYSNLKMLVENQKLRVKLGKEGIEYVKKRHDSIKIAKHIIGLYEQL